MINYAVLPVRKLDKVGLGYICLLYGCISNIQRGEWPIVSPLDIILGGRKD